MHHMYIGEDVTFWPTFVQPGQTPPPSCLFVCFRNSARLTISNFNVWVSGFAEVLSLGTSVLWILEWVFKGWPSKLTLQVFEMMGFNFIKKPCFWWWCFSTMTSWRLWELPVFRCRHVQTIHRWEWFSDNFGRKPGKRSRAYEKNPIYLEPGFW